MGKPKQPTPPDPRETAGAQTSTNIGTAIANGTMGLIDQVTPDGSLTYSRAGYETWRDPNTGRVHRLPRYRATQTLSDEGERLRRVNNEANYSLATLARDQSARMGEILGTPLDLSNEAVEGRLMELGRARLDPALARRREDLATRLSQQGIKEGSEAFDRAMSRNNESENDAYNQLLLTGRGQAVQEALAARNQPINEITALMSGSQVSRPNFVNASGPQIPNVDVAGLIQDEYGARLNNYNSQMAARNNIMGGLFGLGAARIMASDRRVKTNVSRIGTRPDGLGVYAYEYVWGGGRRIGVMADEVEAIYPEAVLDIGGIKAVDYGRLA